VIAERLKRSQSAVYKRDKAGRRPKNGRARAGGKGETMTGLANSSLAGLSAGVRLRWVLRREGDKIDASQFE
jgi:hypothetical protein